MSSKSNAEVLRSAVIYGANASGKSNLVKALKVFQKVVLESAKSDDEFDIQSHAFGDEYKNNPSEFDINFVSDDVRYNYGFKIYKNSIIEEWLFAYPEGRAQKWISREGKNRSDWYLNPSIKGHRKIWIESTRDNALILSTALQLNAISFFPIKEWFQKKLRVYGHGFNSKYTVERSVKDIEFKKKVLEFMGCADFGINDFSVNEIKYSLDNLPPDVPKAILDFLKTESTEDQENAELVRVDLKSIHFAKNGAKAEFDFNDESDGTQKVFNMAGPWLDTLDKGRVLIMDEMDTSLHPLIVKYLVSQFNNPEKNNNNAQLVFTTHDTSLLNQNLYRRDQIWFCEKNKDKQTSVYSLHDFQVRKDENFEKGYLGGRYGALPFVWN